MEVFVILVAVVCLLTTYFMRWYAYRAKLPPGPTGLPILGYIPFLSDKPHLDLQRLAKKFGNVLSLRLGSTYVVVLNDFKSTKEAFSQVAFMGRPAGTTFVQNKESIKRQAFIGLPWKEHRRLTLHMLRDLGFGKSKMEIHIQEEINNVLDELERNSGKPFRIQDVLAPSTSNNIGRLLLGKRLEYDDPVRQMLTKNLWETGPAAGQTTWPLFLPWIRKIFSHLGFGNIDKVDRQLTEIRDYFMKEITEHEKTLDPSNIRDYIDRYLLETEKRKDPSFSRFVLQDMVFAFFGAGSQTVLTTVQWLLLTVAAHRDAQSRIHREIDDTVEKNQNLTWMDHKRMPFTEAFTMELLRWRNIVPINVLRYALFEGKINGYVIPKGSQLMANLWAIHHDPEYWGQDAEEFRPERFLTEDGKVKKFEHYIPFSIGKRACPGEPLAKIEAFLYFTSILQKFEVRVPEGKVADFEGQFGICLVPKPQDLIFTNRN